MNLRRILARITHPAHPTPDTNQPPRAAAVYWNTNSHNTGTWTPAQVDIQPGPMILTPTEPDCPDCQTIEHRNQGGSLILTTTDPCPRHQLIRTLEGIRTPDQINLDALAGIAAWLEATDAGLTTHEHDNNQGQP